MVTLYLYKSSSSGNVFYSLTAALPVGLVGRNDASNRTRAALLSRRALLVEILKEKCFCGAGLVVGLQLHETARSLTQDIPSALVIQEDDDRKR